ncbi:hypothetical protein MC885_010965, partial [Smutsia gigantea]
QGSQGQLEGGRGRAQERNRKRRLDPGSQTQVAASPGSRSPFWSRGSSPEAGRDPSRTQDTHPAPRHPGLCGREPARRGPQDARSESRRRRIGSGRLGGRRAGEESRGRRKGHRRAGETKRRTWLR